MYIEPDHPNLAYCGRIDHFRKKAPVMVYPCSFVSMRFSGSSLTVYLENHAAYWDSYIGYLMDGRQGCIRLEKTGKHSYVIPAGDPAAQTDGQPVHECMLFKRMDACHHVTFYGLELAEGGQILEPPAPAERRMEFYGDSVSAGEVSEASAYAGKEDPVHNGEYSNSWYSYAWMTARKLNAAIHDIAQGGAALMDKTGWFEEPDAVGMESIYDKIEYNPQLGESRPWDFSSYIPHVVVIAIGQNDSHPLDYMAVEPDGEKARIWKQRYAQFVRTIRSHYPEAAIILATTILEHHVHWDEAIEEVCRQMADAKVVHFLYSKNGCGTPGHVRISEAEQMAEELSTFIKSLGEEIWEQPPDGKERSAADGKERSAADGKERSAADGKERSAADGKERSAADGKERSAANGNLSSGNRKAGGEI